MDHPYLQVAMRYLHIVSAVLAVGGMAFISLCLRPSLRLVDDTFRDSIARLVQRRFDNLVLLSIAGLSVSGVYNWYMFAGPYRDLGPVGQALIGTKVLLAVVMFCIVFARILGMLKPTYFWHMLNLHLGAVVILLAVVLRYVRLHSGS